MIKKNLIIIFFLFLTTNSYSKETIAYIDIDYIFRNSNIGKKIISTLNKKNEDNLTKLKAKQVLLEKDEKNLKIKKKLLSESEFNKKLTDLRSKIKLYRIEKDDLVKNFEKKKNDEVKIFFIKVNPILEKYMSENSIKIVIDKKNVLIASDNLDITEDIYNLVNKELK